MFAALFRPMLGQNVIRSSINCTRSFCQKQSKHTIDKQLKNELRLIAIKEFVIKENKENNGNIDWNRILSQLAEQKMANKFNFEIDLMTAFIMNATTDPPIDKKLFDSMVKFIKRVPTFVNNSIAASRYCQFISHFNEYIEESDIDMIRRTTDQLMTKYLDNRLTSNVLNPSLIGLSKSSKDNCLYSVKLLDRMKEKDMKPIQQIMESTLDFNLFDQTIDLLEKHPKIRLNETFISKLVISLSESKSSFNQTFKLFKILSQTLIVLDMNLMSKIIEIMKRFSYKTNITSIGRNGLCLKCDQRLSGVTTEEQIALIKDFRTTIFNKENDLLMRTFPEYEEELKDFDRFIQKITKKQPLDVVIDGLNLAFSINPIITEDKKNLRQFKQTFPPHVIDANFVDLLQKLNIEKYDNILIIGRKHMKTWKQLNQFIIRTNLSQKISMFYVMNKTQDDCYILYATLLNPNAFLISGDFYRDFCEKMSKKGILFERWLKTHQISNSRNSKQFVFPHHFDHRIHISENNKKIHIPFRSNENSGIEWICCHQSERPLKKD